MAGHVYRLLDPTIDGSRELLMVEFKAKPSDMQRRLELEREMQKEWRKFVWEREPSPKHLKDIVAKHFIPYWNDKHPVNQIEFVNISNLC